jgi:hypothetical protein
VPATAIAEQKINKHIAALRANGFIRTRPPAPHRNTGGLDPNLRRLRDEQLTLNQAIAAEKKGRFWG